MKSGLLTTEFWSTVVGAVWTAIEPGLSPTLRAVLPAVLTAVYTVGRVVLKASAAPPPPAATSLDGSAR